MAAVARYGARNHITRARISSRRRATAAAAATALPATTGPPSLLKCSKLTVEGAMVFDAQLRKAEEAGTPESGEMSSPSKTQQKLEELN